MKIFSKLHIASDHAGVDYKKEIKAYFENVGYEVTDYGTDSEASCDYPDYVHPLAKAISSDLSQGGILICGSGNGVCMTANKYPDIRAALCWNKELAELARLHNNANVICIPARFVSLDLAKEMADAFIKTEFEGGRHQRRVEKIAQS
jgi:ribose 5-phosphate isomerase B